MQPYLRESQIITTDVKERATNTPSASKKALDWWRNGLHRLKPHLLALGVVLGACAVAQVVTLKQGTFVEFSGDSNSYLLSAKYVGGPGFFNLYRTPGYPLFLAAFFLFNLRQHLEVIVWAQVMLTIATILEVYVLAYRLGRRRWAAALVATLVGTNLYILTWEQFILTETLSFFLCVTTALYFERYLRQPQRRTLLAVTLGLIAMVFVRPFFLPFPLVFLALLLIWSWRQKRLRTEWRRLALALVAIYVLVLGYMAGNALVNGEFTFSQISNINMFGKVLEYHMTNDTSDPRFALLAQQATAFDQSHIFDPGKTFHNPYTFVRLHPSYAANGWVFLGEYSRTIILHQAPSYAVDSIPDAISCWQHKQEFYRNLTWQPRLVSDLLDLSRLIQPLYLLLPLLFCLLLFWVWKHPTHAPTFMMLSLLVWVLVAILSTGFATYDEFYRMRFPVDWAMVLVSVLVLMDVVIVPVAYFCLRWLREMQKQVRRPQ